MTCVLLFCHRAIECGCTPPQLVRAWTDYRQSVVLMMCGLMPVVCRPNPLLACFRNACRRLLQQVQEACLWKSMRAFRSRAECTIYWSLAFGPHREVLKCVLDMILSEWCGSWEWVQSPLDCYEDTYGRQDLSYLVAYNHTIHLLQMQPVHCSHLYCKVSALALNMMDLWLIDCCWLWQLPRQYHAADHTAHYDTQYWYALSISVLQKY